MESLAKFGRFFRLIDDDGISITNIACYVALVKIAASPSASVTDLGVLLISLLNYAHRRFVQSGVEEPSSPLITDVGPIAADLETLKSKVNAMMVSAGVREIKKL